MIKIGRSIRILLIALATSLTLACSSGSGPGATAEKFMTHLANLEFTEAKAYASPETGQLVEMIGQMGAAMGGKMKKEADFKFILEEENIDGDKAVVKFRKKEGGKIETMNLVKLDGEWKVHEKKK